MKVKDMFPDLYTQENLSKALLVPYIRYHKSIGVDLDESILAKQFERDLQKFEQANERGQLSGNYSNESFWINYIDRNPISGMADFVELIRSL